jgi:hypothetical protein
MIVKPSQSLTGTDLSSSGVHTLSVGLFSGGVIPSTSTTVERWKYFPISEVTSVIFDENSRLVGDYPVVNVWRDEKSPKFIKGIAIFYDREDRIIPVRFQKMTVNVGDAIRRAGEVAAGVEPVIANVPLPRAELERLGATHVDVTPRDEDGSFTTTRSIEVSDVSEVLPGEHGYVVLKSHTARIEGDVRIKVARRANSQNGEDSVPGGFAAQVTQTVRNRGSDYGHPSTNHQLTADMWNAYLSRRLGKEVRMSAEDVCMLNVLQKASRLADGTKDDSWLDIAGYTENVGMLRRDQRNIHVKGGCG